MVLPHIVCDGSVEKKLELKALKESVKEMGNLQDSGKKGRFQGMVGEELAYQYGTIR